LCCFNEFVDHGGRRGDTAQALARWLHPVASSEAPDVIHRAMDPASYRLTRMAIKIASDLPAFFVVVDSLAHASSSDRFSEDGYFKRPIQPNIHGDIWSVSGWVFVGFWVGRPLSRD
jgi:hypothetical protein